jgi:hypothetical protein
MYMLVKANLHEKYYVEKHLECAVPPLGERGCSWNNNVMGWRQKLCEQDNEIASNALVQRLEVE